MSGNLQCLILELADVISNGLGLSKTTLSVIVVGIALFIGFILTFKGKKCFKYTLTIIACLSGILAPFFVTGLHHCENLEAVRIKGNWWIIGSVSIVCGAILGILTHHFYKGAIGAASIVFGWSGGYILAQTIRNNTELSHWGVDVTVCVLCAVIAGWLSLKVLTPTLRILTAIIGAFLVVASCGYYVEMSTQLGQPITVSWNHVCVCMENGFGSCNWQMEMVSVVIWIVLTILGAVVQFMERSIAVADESWKGWADQYLHSGSMEGAVKGLELV